MRALRTMPARLPRSMRRSGARRRLSCCSPVWKENAMSDAEPRKKWDFFISYASEDRATAAEPLAAALRSRGFAVWLDRDALTGDASALTSEIQAGLTDCHAGIVILSRQFVRKDWPIRELETLLSLETVDGRLRIV